MKYDAYCCTRVTTSTCLSCMHDLHFTRHPATTVAAEGQRGYNFLVSVPVASISLTLAYRTMAHAPETCIVQAATGEILPYCAPRKKISHHLSSDNVLEESLRIHAWIHELSTTCRPESIQGMKTPIGTCVQIVLLDEADDLWRYLLMA